MFALDEVARWLQPWDIEMAVADAETLVADRGRATIELRRGASRLRAKLLFGSHITLTTALERLDDNPTVIATPAISPRTASAFRRAGLQYVDAAGNAFLEFGDVLIDVQGRRADGPRHPKPAGAINMFTPNRSKVICALLTWPPLWNAPRREVARAAGVSVGQAHQTLTTLTELGYAWGDSEFHQLLELWTAAFPAGLARQLVLDTFNGPPDAPIKTEHVLYVSGERAVDDLLRPASQVVYVPALDVELPLRNRWRKDAQPNVVVRAAFWRDPYEGAGAPLIRSAPWPLVYADLSTSDDSRVRKAAEVWRARHA